MMLAWWLSPDFDRQLWIIFLQFEWRFWPDSVVEHFLEGLSLTEKHLVRTLLELVSGQVPPFNQVLDSEISWFGCRSEVVIQSGRTSLLVWMTLVFICDLRFCRWRKKSEHHFVSFRLFGPGFWLVRYLHDSFFPSLSWSTWWGCAESWRAILVTDQSYRATLQIRIVGRFTTIVANQLLVIHHFTKVLPLLLTLQLEFVIKWRRWVGIG